MTDETLGSDLLIGSLIFCLAILSCLCCIYMRVSDNKLKNYVIDLAKRRGYRVDLDKLNTKEKPCPSPHMNENCTILIPDVVIVL